MKFNVNDRVQVGSRIGALFQWATVVEVLPSTESRKTLYRVRFDTPVNRDGRRSSSVYLDETLQMTENDTIDECWVDENIIYGPFHDQDSPYYH